MARWVLATTLDRLVEGIPLLVSVEGEDVAVFRVGDEVYAIDDLCSHAQASLSEGEQRGYIIACPQHGGKFDIRSGRATRFPAVSSVRCYPVRLEGNAVLIDAEAW